MLQFKVEPRHVGWLLGTLIAIELVLLAIYVITALDPSPSQIGVLFNLDEEANVPAWFSSMQLFSIGFMLLLASLNPLRVQDHLRGLLLVLGGAFIFFSMDEAAGFHEKVTTVMSRVTWAPRFSGGHGIWIFVYLAIAVAMVAALFRPIIQLCRFYTRDVIGFAVGVIVLGAGAVGVEAVGYEQVGANASRGTKTLQVAAEEFLEMLGASIILISALRFALHEKVPVPSAASVAAFRGPGTQRGPFVRPVR